MRVQRTGHQSVGKARTAETIVTASLDSKFLENRHDRVAALAHELWDKRGRPVDDDWTDWLAAEAIAQENGSS